MASYIETDVRVLGGLPITVEFSVQGAEPDVGIMGAYVDDWDIVAIGGRPCRKADWIVRRIEATPKEKEALMEALNEAVSEAAYNGDY